MATASWRDGELIPLAREDQSVPGGHRIQSLAGVSTSVNAGGEVVFRASLNAGQAVFLAEPDGSLRLVAGTGDPLPGGDSIEGAMTGPIVNARGQVAFYTHTTEGRRAIVVADPDGTLRTVVHTGQVLDGATVTDVAFAGNEPGRKGFNDHGQVVFLAQLEHRNDVREAIFLVHPDSY